MVTFRNCVRLINKNEIMLQLVRPLIFSLIKIGFFSLSQSYNIKKFEKHSPMRQLHTLKTIHRFIKIQKCQRITIF